MEPILSTGQVGRYWGFSRIELLMPSTLGRLPKPVFDSWENAALRCPTLSELLSTLESTKSKNWISMLNKVLDDTAVARLARGSGQNGAARPH